MTNNTGKQSDGSNAKVEDPENLNQSQRLREIHEARQQVRSVRNKTRSEQVFGSIADGQLDGVYRAAVESYILSLQPLIVSEEVEDSARLWDSEEIGEFVVRAPGKTQTVTIKGVKDILYRNSPLELEFRVETNSERAGKTSERRIVQKEIPRRVLDRAVMKCDRFRQDIGLGIDVESTKTTKITDDLIQEVEEWREENI